MAFDQVSDFNRFWYHNAVFYAIDVSLFSDGNGDGIGDFPGLIDSLDYLSWLGVDAIWLMPFYKSPRLDNGYDIEDHCSVDPRFGTIEDFSRLVTELERRNIRLLVDLVVNHTSDCHEWFRKALKDPDSDYRDRYVWIDDPANAPQLKPVFPGPEESVWTYAPQVGAWYLHHFYSFQPEVNHRHPEVVKRIRETIEFWLDLGVDGFRLDAAPLLGDDLSDQRPDPHALVSRMRKWIMAKNPDAVLLGEADLEPELLPAYFGEEHDDEVQLLFNFILNQHLFLAAADESARPIDKAFDILPGIPLHGQWVHYLRNHDELSLERLTGDEREPVYRAFAPDPSMQIYNRGIRRRFAPMLNNDRQHMELMYSLEFSLPGTALMIYGNEIGLGEDLSLPERYAVRLPMPWDGLNAIPGADCVPPTQILVPDLITRTVHPVFHETRQRFEEHNEFVRWVQDLLAVRKSSSDIMAGTFRRLDVGSDSVYAHRWDGTDESLICLHNLSKESRDIDIPDIEGEARELIGSGEPANRRGDVAHLKLEGYGYRWIRTSQVGTGWAAGLSTTRALK
jgi:maltose alpha-D-glucosyltransferase/alpha-amylase